MGQAVPPSQFMYRWCPVVDHRGRREEWYEVDLAVVWLLEGRSAASLCFH